MPNILFGALKLHVRVLCPNLVPISLKTLFFFEKTKNHFQSISKACFVCDKTIQRPYLELSAPLDPKKRIETM